MAWEDTAASSRATLKQGLWQQGGSDSECAHIARSVQLWDSRRVQKQWILQEIPPELGVKPGSCVPTCFSPTKKVSRPTASSLAHHPEPLSPQCPGSERRSSLQGKCLLHTPPPPTAGQQPPRSRLPVGLRWSHTAISAHTLWLETLSERKPGAMLCLSQFSGKA